MTRILSSFFALVAMCSAQVTSTTTLGTAISNGDVIVSGGGSAGSFITTAQCSTCGWVTVRDPNTVYGIPLETRKPAAVPSIQQVKFFAKIGKPISMAPADYIARAQKIGLESAGVDEARLLQAIHDTSLKNYDFHRVDDYLYRMALKQGASYRWVWTPLRKHDVDTIQSNGLAGSAAMETAGYVFNKQYAREIPERVLNDIANLIECAPDAIFLVSDYKAVNPDPFLAVTTQRLLEAGKVFIVDQWDEPGFRDGAVDPALTIALK